MKSMFKLCLVHAHHKSTTHFEGTKYKHGRKKRHPLPLTHPMQCKLCRKMPPFHTLQFGTPTSKLVALESSRDRNSPTSPHLPNNGPSGKPQMWRSNMTYLHFIYIQLCKDFCDVANATLKIKSTHTNHSMSINKATADP